jgi:hypothetical protein
MKFSGLGMLILMGMYLEWIVMEILCIQCIVRMIKSILIMMEMK